MTRAAMREVDASDLLISPMVYLEMSYLFRRRRCVTSAPEMYANLGGTLGVTLCTLPFPMIALLAAECEWTGDPFDRLIVANAQANQNARLITADETIRQHYPNAIW
jgi:PIN domain nuclease of toxin-antitoxin system